MAHSGLILPRFLAVILLAFAIPIAPAAVCGLVVAARGGQWQSVSVAAAMALFGGTIGWLGLVLWSGRIIPRWFIAGFLFLLIAGQVMCAFHCETWTESLVLVGMVAPSAGAFRSIVRSYPGKPLKPAMFDEF